MMYYKVYMDDGEGKVWQVPPQLAVKFNLKENDLVILKFGSLSIQTNVKLVSLSFEVKQRMGFSREVLAALKIPEDLALAIQPDGTGQFRFGPIIGILTFSHVIRKKQLNRYINYANFMKDSGLLYVFEPSSIQPQTKTIRGFHYDKIKAAWEEGEYPYPNVVIDRMYPNDYKTHFELEKVIGKNRIFNKKTLINKIEFNTALEKDPLLKDYIPETKLLLTLKDLNYFLTKYDEVFLKPTDSMRGRGIIYITANQNELICRYMDGRIPVKRKIHKAEYVFEVLGQVCEYKRPFVIQAAINRMKFMGRPFSFRVMTTKDGSGCWSVPIIVAKAAGPGELLTNISAGADYVLLKDLGNWIKEQLPDKNTDFLNQLINLSLKTSKTLDIQFGPLGKLGIDAVMDASGKIWLIEANGNPGVIFRRGQREFPAWHTQVYEHPLSYAMFLAGFSKFQ